MPSIGRKVADVHAEMHIDGEDLPREIRGELREVIDESEEAGQKAGTRFGNSFRKGSKREMAKFDGAFRSFISGWRDGFRGLDRESVRFHIRIGRLFGRGSRNDFLHFIGGIAQGLAGLPRLITGSVRGLLQFASHLRSVFQAGQASGKTLGGLRAVLGSLSGALAAAGASAAVLVATAGILVTTLSSLLAIVVALTATIATALVGAVGVLAGAMLPLAALVGGLVIAFQNISEKQSKRLKSAFQGITDTISAELRPAVGSLVDDLGELLDSKAAQGFAKSIGTAVGNVIESFGEALNSPQMRGFLRTMGRHLPEQIEILGRVAENVLSGLGGLFEALAPSVTSFLEWLEDITAQFSEWSNSAKGRREIRQFMERAGRAAKAFGKFLEATGGLLAKLLFGKEGVAAGNGLFEDMADSIQKFSDSLDPEDIKAWFEQGKEMAQTIGDIIEAVGSLTAALDDPIFLTFLRGIILPMTTGMDLFATAIDDTLDSLADFGSAMSDLWNAIRELDWEGIGLAIKEGIEAGLSAAFGISGLKAIAEKVINGFKSVFGISSPATTMIPIGRDVMAGLIKGIVTAPIKFGGKILKKILGEFNGAGGWLEERGQRIVAGLVNGINSFLDRVGNMVSRARGQALRGMAGAGVWLLQRGRSLLLGVVNGARDRLGRIDDVVGRARGFAWRALSGAGTWLKGRGSQLVQGLINGITSRLGDVGRAAGSLVDKFNNTLGGLKGFIFGSPSKLTDQYGEWIVEGLIDGIRSNESALTREAKRIVEILNGELDGNQFRSRATLTGSAAVEPFADGAAAASRRLADTSASNRPMIDASGWTIQTPSENPEAVAKEVLDDMTGKML